jgi:uncharacterized protein YoxC
MSAEESLFGSYHEWHRLTVAAGRAIRIRNWNFLRECQQVIQNLQPQITRLTREVRAEWRQSEADLATKERSLNAVISELIELGQRNRSLLQAARQAAQPERERLEQAGQNLRRLQQSYTVARPAAWTSFS